MILWVVLLIFIVVLLLLCKSQEPFRNPKNQRNCILVVSIGNRSHLSPLRKSQQDYAHKCNAYFLTHDYPSLSDVPPKYLQQISWYHPQTQESPKYRARMLKMVFLREALQQWERVLLLDDSCFVTPLAPNLFDLVPPEDLGVAKELGELRHCTKFNSGVLLASHNFLGILRNLEPLFQETSKAIREGTLTWCGVDQTILNYATDKYRTQIFYLDPKFNLVSSLITPEIIENRDAYIYHLTGTNHQRTLRFVGLLTDKS